MRKIVFLLLFASPVAAACQIVATISPNDCVYRVGDDAGWASPTLDESQWKPYAGWRASNVPSILWIRCHANVTDLHGAARPAVQVRLYAAYEVFFNGTKIGAFGELEKGNFSLNAIRFYPVSFGQPQATVVLRVRDRGSVYNPGPAQRIIDVPLELQIGDATLLEALRAREVVAGASRYGETSLYYEIVGILSLPLLALYFFDRSRTAVLLLALAAISVSVLRINEFAAATFSSYSLSTCLVIMVACNTVVIFTEFPFYFVLARGRVPVTVWVFIGLVLLTFLPTDLDAFNVVRNPGLSSASFVASFRTASFFLYLAMSALPFVAFWPYSSITRRMAPLAACCFLWGAVDFIWFLTELTATGIPGVPNLYARWGITLLSGRGIATACVIAALLGLLFREQRHIALDRAILAGELQAAREIQSLLAPRQIDTAPGLHIDVAFHPMREVGGDFYLCRVLPDGRQRILLGDVSGKGAAAAMAAALLLGAAEERSGDSPQELLAHLNRVLCRAHIGGFATCLCVDVLPGGEIVIANAGHLSPFSRGVEIATPGALPLGVSVESEFTASRAQLGPGDALTLISDGVVEARNQAGDLFGFERAGVLSTRSPAEMAEAAQAFGQEDDITVLTLSFGVADPAPPAATAAAAHA